MIRKQIEQTCHEIEAMLVAKNEGYGNSALDPLRIFSQCNSTEQLAVRVDDKLSRIARGKMMAIQGEDYYDTLRDLIGYLILLLVAMKEGKSNSIK